MLQNCSVRRIFLVICAAWLLSSIAQAHEPIESRLLHENPVFRVEIQNPVGWGEHPILSQAWKAIAQSREVQSRLTTPEYQRVLAAKDYLESASGQGWREAIENMTAGGIWAHINPKPIERVTLVVAAKEADLWKRLQTAAVKTIRNQGGKVPGGEPYNGATIFPLDNAHLAFVGRRLLFATQKSDLQNMVDRLSEHKGKAKRDSTAAQAGPAFRLSVNLPMVRQAPDFKKALTRPADDAGQVAILGGWADLLRSADELRLELKWPQKASSIALNVTARNASRETTLPGFFAQSPGDALAPLLNPPGTIYSASWFRDYRTLWQERSSQLTESALEKIEKGDADVKQQFSVFGVSFTPSKLFSALGKQFRVVLARPMETEYRIDLKNQLPAAALCVSLPDEKAFLEQAEPLSRAISLIASFGEAKMLSKTSQHDEATLKGLWFRDDEKASRQGDQIRYSFNPTWTVTRDHFIVGSTRNIVSQVIEELDRLAMNSTDPAHESTQMITERQSFSFTELSRGFDDFQAVIVQGSVLQRGLTFADSLKELKFAQDAIRALGRLTTEAAFTEQGFEYRIRLGNPAD